MTVHDHGARGSMGLRLEPLHRGQLDLRFAGEHFILAMSGRQPRTISPAVKPVAFIDDAMGVVQMSLREVGQWNYRLRGP